MNLLGALLCVVLFAVLVHVVGLVERTREVLAISRASAATLRDPTLADEVKEHAIQRGAVRLFRLLFVLVIGTLICLLVPLGVIRVLQITGLTSLDGVLAMLTRWDFLLAGTAVGVFTYLAIGKWRNRSL